MEDSIIKIKLVLEDKSEKQTDISVPSSCLNINDDFVEQLFGMKFRSVYKELHADRETGC